MSIWEMWISHCFQLTIIGNPILYREIQDSFYMKEYKEKINIIWNVKIVKVKYGIYKFSDITI